MSFFESFQQQLQQTTQQLQTSINNLSIQETAAQISKNVQDNLNNLSIQDISKNVQNEVNNLKPIIARTSRSIQEKLGSINDISELPKEYKDLELKVDLNYKFLKQLLQITKQYELESYDNPLNLKESLNDYSLLINEKFTELSKASSTKEAEQVLLSGRKERVPNTFAHQFGKFMKNAREEFNASDECAGAGAGEESSLSKSLLKISEVEMKIGNERLEQDKLIMHEVNEKIENMLKNDFSKCMKLRNQVETCRLNFDTVRAEIKSYGETATGEQGAARNALNDKLEKFEDELVNATEIAVESMKELIKPLESINMMKVLFKIQLNYHKSVVSELGLLVDSLDSISLEDD